MKKKRPIEAIVQSIENEGPKRFAVTNPTKNMDKEMGQQNGTITFSIAVWEGDQEPRKNQIVLLYGVQKFRGGWRAQRATPVQL